MTTIFIHTLSGARPPARTDGVPWTDVRIEYALAESGPWSPDTTQSLDPLDSNPSSPQSHDLTFSSVVSEAFFRLVFVDGIGSQSSPTEPVFDDGSGIAWRPSIDEVAALVRNRTYSTGEGKDLGGELLGTFSAKTSPTASEVNAMIGTAVFEVNGRIEGSLTSQSEINYAKGVVALRAAMSVELEYSPEEAEAGDSRYDKLKELYEQGVSVLMASMPDTNQTQKGIYSIRLRSEIGDVFPTGGLLP